MIGLENYHFKIMSKKLKENKCIMCGTKFNGEGKICSQECDVKIHEKYGLISKDINDNINYDRFKR